MRRAPKRRRYTLDEGLQSQREEQEHAHAVGPEAEEEDTSSSSSSCSSSFPSSFSSSSSCYPLVSSNPSTPEEAVGETLSPPQSPPSACSSSNVIASTPCSSQEEAGPSNVQAMPPVEPLPRCIIDDRVGDLVGFLLLKYRTKELTTKAEMLSRIMEEYHNLFPVIFSEASECMQLVFGINMIEVDPNEHSYTLSTNLGLTYDGIVGDGHSMPKTGILILILCIIFMEGNRVSEEEIWEKLSFMGLHDGREHCIYGEPRELLTKIWVQEQYVEYRQVPNSCPPRYEFLWGPRAHAETSKMKVLEFLARINSSEPRSFPLWYEEALREEEERSQARIATTDDTVAVASTSSSAVCSSSSCHK